VHTIETNITGTERVLHAASKKRKPVFLASTSEVYGKNTHGVFREDDDLVLGPTSKSRWGYAASKAVDEFLALAYCKEQKLPVTIGRFFNTVGPRQTGRYGMVLPTFLTQALSNETITIFGSGKQSRCFGYVGEVVEAIYRLMNTSNSVGKVVNIGNDHEITIEELALLIKGRVGSESAIQYVPYEEAYESGFEDMFRRKPCLDRLEKLTGFRPKMRVSEIVDRILQSVPEAKTMTKPRPISHVHASVRPSALAASASSD
jgi:UDP-glucose 4-epimerase